MLGLPAPGSPRLPADRRPTEESMSLRANAMLRTFLLVAVAALAAGCGGASATASLTHPPKAPVTASPSSGITASPSAAASGSPSASVGASASPSSGDRVTIGLPHVDAALEDLLPSIIGGVDLVRFSEPLASYSASSAGGDKRLYPPWLVKFGKTPDDVNIAIATDLTHFVVHAIKVPGVDDATLTSSFADVARTAGWPVSAKSIGPRSVLEIVDPTGQAAGLLGDGYGYVYAKGGVLFVVITDDPSLLLEALIKLP